MGENRGRVQQRASGGGALLQPTCSGEPVDEAVLLQLQELSRSRALVLMGDFGHPDTCWESGTAGGSQCRRFLESVEDNFLGQVTDGPTRGEALLGLVLSSAEESIGEVKIGGSLGCSDHASVHFVIWRNAGLATSRVRTRTSRGRTSVCSRNCWLRSPGKLSLRA